MDTEPDRKALGAQHRVLHMGALDRLVSVGVVGVGDEPAAELCELLFGSLALQLDDLCWAGRALDVARCAGRGGRWFTAARAWPARGPISIEQVFSRLSCDDTICDLVRVGFMRIAHLAHASLEMDASALLHDVRCFVRSGMKVGGRGERNMVAGRECLRPHRL